MELLWHVAVSMALPDFRHSPIPAYQWSLKGLSLVAAMAALLLWDRY
jgi:hypothetical protein